MWFVPVVSIDLEGVSIVPIETALCAKPHEADTVLCNRIDRRLRETFPDRHAFESQRRLLRIHTMNQENREEGGCCASLQRDLMGVCAASGHGLISSVLLRSSASETAKPPSSF